MAASRKAKPDAEVESGPTGYAVSRFNAVRHGVLSRETVLPWEDAGAYQALLRTLAEEHRPEGPTEAHLVEELAGVVWRKRRLRGAEAGLALEGLRRATRELRTGDDEAAWLAAGGAVAEAVDGAPEAEAKRELRALKREQVTTFRALVGLRTGGVYEAGLAALGPEVRELWLERLALAAEGDGPEEAPYAPDAAGLARFLESEVRPVQAARREALEQRPYLRLRALREAYDPARLQALARYEAHLDRKLERTLAMLVRLKELRREGAAPDERLKS